MPIRAKEFYPGIFSRHAAPYRARLEKLMKSGEAAGRFAVLDAVRARPGMHILDLGCGPGTITLPLAHDLAGEGEVIGVDLADGMLAAAREAAKGQALAIRFLKMDYEVLQFPAQTFNAVTSAHALQFAPNLGRVLREVRRVLKVRGTFAASVPAPATSAATQALVALLDVRLGRAPEPEDTAATRAIVSVPDRFQAAAVEAGLRAVEVERVDSEASWESALQFATMSLSWWSYAARVETLSAHVLEMIVEEAARAVETVTGSGPFLVPGAAYVLKAEA